MNRFKIATDATGYIDPTSYYPDFWNYASLYGEEAARAYYTTWSPPVGTPPPPGIVLPGASAAAVTIAPAPPADGVSTSTDTTSGGSQPTPAAPSADGTAAAQSDMSPEAIAAAWEAYNKQVGRVCLVSRFYIRM
jgi:hypothetical protein